MPNYIRLLLGPFFRWWWAAATGVIGLLAFAVTAETVELSKPWMLAVVLLISVLLFIAMAVLVQGWGIYSKKLWRFDVHSLHNDECADLGADWVFILQGPDGVDAGAILQVCRRLESNVEVPFALVRILGRNEQGCYQGVPVWRASAHFGDFSKGRFTSDSLLVVPCPEWACIKRFVLDDGGSLNG